MISLSPKLAIHSLIGALHLFLCLLGLLCSQLQAQTQSPEQTLVAMEKCRDQVIAGLSFSEKMKMKAAMSAIKSKPDFVAANNAVKNASTPEEQIAAKKTLAKVKLDLITQQDSSLKPVVEKIRIAQSTVLR